MPYISKDITTSGVFSEEEAIMRAQQLKLIYSQFNMLYDILLDAPWSTFDLAKPKSGPHADGIVGSAQNKHTDLLSNQMKQLLLQQIVASQTSSMATPATQTPEVHTMQTTNPNGNQQPEEKKKSKGNKGRGGNDKKAANNAGEGKNERRRSSSLVSFERRTT